MADFEEVAEALGLDPNSATEEDLVGAFKQFLAGLKRKKADPRWALTALVEEISQKNHVGFTEALAEAKKRQPELVRAVVQFYGRET